MQKRLQTGLRQLGHAAENIGETADRVGDIPDKTCEALHTLRNYLQFGRPYAVLCAERLHRLAMMIRDENRS